MEVASLVWRDSSCHNYTLLGVWWFCGHIHQPHVQGLPHSFLHLSASSVLCGKYSTAYGRRGAGGVAHIGRMGHGKPVSQNKFGPAQPSNPAFSFGL